MDRLKRKQRWWRSSVVAMSSPCSCACASTNWSVDYGYGGGGVLSNSKGRSRRSKEISMAHSVCGSRRSTALVISSLPFGFLFLSPPAEARRNKKAIPEDQYITSRELILVYFLSCINQFQSYKCGF